MMKKVLLTLIPVLLILTGLLALLNLQEDPTPSDPERVSVFASFYPLAFIAEEVGGELVQVTNVTPAGAEPHDFEPTPQDIARISSASLLLGQGAGLDPWVKKLADQQASGTVRIVQMADEIPFDTFIEEEDEEAEDHGDFDPHVWLDPVRMQDMVTVVRDELITMDGAHADTYTTQAAVLLNELQQLHNEYTTGLETCALRTIITSHDAFGYLTRRYNIEAIHISGISPEEEPSLQTLGTLTDLIRAEGIQYIFFETLASPRLAETLANETNTQTLVLNPIEGLTDEEVAFGETYMTVMRKNLAALRIALNCQ